MIARSLGIGFLFGAIFGGLAHLWLMDDAALAAVRTHGLSTMYWVAKPPGESLAFYLIVYLFACSLFLALFLLGVLSQTTMMSMYRRNYRPFTWWVSWGNLLAAAGIGAGMAGGANLWLMTGEIQSAAADGEWYSISTAPVALPAMRNFTLAYWGVLLICLTCGFLLCYSWRVWRMTTRTNSAV